MRWWRPDEEGTFESTTSQVYTAQDSSTFCKADALPWKGASDVDYHDRKRRGDNSKNPRALEQIGTRAPTDTLLEDRLQTS